MISATGHRLEHVRVDALQHALQPPLDHLGVKLGAIVERDALTQLEGPGQAILGSLPTVGQARLELVVVVDGHQRLVDHDVGFHGGGRVKDVKGLAILVGCRHDQRHLPCRLRGGGDDLFHLLLDLLTSFSTSTTSVTTFSTTWASPSTTTVSFTIWVTTFSTTSGSGAGPQPAPAVAIRANDTTKSTTVHIRLRLISHLFLLLSLL